MLVALVVLPGRRSVHDRREQLRVLKDQESFALARLNAYEEFLRALRQGDEQIIRRLAASHLNLVPEGETAIMLASSLDHTVPDWIDDTLDVTPSLATPYPDTLLIRLAEGRNRLWLLCGSVLVIFFGLIMGPEFETRPRRRRAEQALHGGLDGSTATAAATAIAAAGAAGATAGYGEWAEESAATAVLDEEAEIEGEVEEEVDLEDDLEAELEDETDVNAAVELEDEVELEDDADLEGERGGDDGVASEDHPDLGSQPQHTAERLLEVPLETFGEGHLELMLPAALASLGPAIPAAGDVGEDPVGLIGGDAGRGVETSGRVAGDPPEDAPRDTLELLPQATCAEPIHPTASADRSQPISDVASIEAADDDVLEESVVDTEVLDEEVIEEDVDDEVAVEEDAEEAEIVAEAEIIEEEEVAEDVGLVEDDETAEGDLEVEDDSEEPGADVEVEDSAISLDESAGDPPDSDDVVSVLDALADPVDFDQFDAIEELDDDDDTGEDASAADGPRGGRRR